MGEAWYYCDSDHVAFEIDGAPPAASHTVARR
jgi:hypothetical protein